MKNTYLILLIVGLLFLGITWFLYANRSNVKAPGDITNFLECEAAGYPIMESYPRQCRTPNGKTFVEVLPTPTDTVPGLANPASVYCEENGGTVDIRDEEAGQVGYCKFPAGGECEEWAYYRGECTPIPSSMSTPQSQ